MCQYGMDFCGGKGVRVSFVLYIVYCHYEKLFGEISADGRNVPVD